MISVYVDLAIGLVLAFLLLSLLVSGINEGLVRLLSVRSKFLWAYLRDTLDGGLQANDPRTRVLRVLTRVMERLCRLPLIGRMARSVFRDFVAGSARSRLPTTVAGVFLKFPFTRDPRPVFSDEPAPKEIPITGSVADAVYERLQEIDHYKGGKTAISQIPPERFGVAVMELAMGHGGVQPLLNRLRDQGSPLFRPLQSVWESVSDDLDAFRAGAQRWFDGEMQRLTMLYRRYVRWVVALIGLIVTLAFSVDSLQYGKELLNDAALRSTVAAFADAGTEQLTSLRDMCAGTPESTDAYACVTQVLSTPAFVEVFGNGPLSLTLPDSGTPHITWNAAAWWDRVTMPEHWPGFLITFIALLFGASFWWDVLRRLTGLRPRKDAGGM
ncbi:hypothetical protein AB0K60_10545 [Thermopolyspora sp. NPDC052614]|uniref:hypothetical protein n=1 Tax=Thermopolyspora sp. NPDC052614 TaxID=3155682 RepID=UPI00343F3DF7